MKICDMCKPNDRNRKAVWFHKAKYTEVLCDICYKAQVKFYSEFKKKPKQEKT